MLSRTSPKNFDGSFIAVSSFIVWKGVPIGLRKPVYLGDTRL